MKRRAGFGPQVFTFPRVTDVVLSDAVTHLLDELQRDPVLAQLLVDEDEGGQVAHPSVQQLVRQPTRALHHHLVVLHQSGGETKQISEQICGKFNSTAVPRTRPSFYLYLGPQTSTDLLMHSSASCTLWKRE